MFSFFIRIPSVVTFMIAFLTMVRPPYIRMTTINTIISVVSIPFSCMMMVVFSAVVRATLSFIKTVKFSVVRT